MDILCVLFSWDNLGVETHYVAQLVPGDLETWLQAKTKQKLVLQAFFAAVGVLSLYWLVCSNSILERQRVMKAEKAVCVNRLHAQCPPWHCSFRCCLYRKSMEGMCSTGSLMVSRVSWGWAQGWGASPEDVVCGRRCLAGCCLVVVPEQQQWHWFSPHGL